MESLVGHAKKAKESVEQRSGLKPILSLETKLTIPRLKKLIDLTSDRFIPKMLPPLKEKTVLEIGEGPLRFQNGVLQREPRIFCGLVVRPDYSTSAKGSSPWIVKGTMRSIPFEQNYFDCIVANLMTPHQGDVISAFKEMGRLLVPEGLAYILDFHPFGAYSKSGTERLHSPQATIRGLEDYYQMCKISGLTIVDLHEGFLDDTLRHEFTTPEELQTYRDLRGTPLVLFLMVTKPRRKS